MHDDFLLRLYRLARESAAGEFQPAAIKLVKSALDFESAFWGEGRILPKGAGAVLKAATTHGLDAEFLPIWQNMNFKDAVIPMLLAHPGQSLEIQVPQVYKSDPERVARGNRFAIRSFSVTSDFAPNLADCRWLILYRPEPDTSGEREDLAWLEYLMPHLGEALRIHRALHPLPGLRSDACSEHLAVADRQSGALLNVDAGFCNALASGWKAFDGVRVPLPLRDLWKEADRFCHHGRSVTVIGTCVADLVLVTVQSRSSKSPMTRRQLEIATDYAQGWSHKDIAGKAKVSPATVRNHLATVYAALDVHSRRELAVALGRK